MEASEPSIRPMGTNGGAEVITVPSPRPAKNSLFAAKNHQGVLMKPWLFECFNGMKIPSKLVTIYI